MTNLPPPTTPLEMTPTPECTEVSTIYSTSQLPSISQESKKISRRLTNSWSLSAVGTYEKCPLKAKYRYVDRLEDKRSVSAVRGVNSHKAVEDFIKGEVPTLPDALSYYQSFLTGIRSYENYPEHIIELNDQWQPTKEGEDYWYKGVLDLKVVAPTEITIYDWKTGKIYPDHEDQKSLYSVAAFSEHPDVFSVRAIHVYLDLRVFREKSFHRDQMHELRATWNDRAGKYLNALKVPESMIPNPGWHCRYCSFSRANGGPCKF
jgi:ATP-dependent exoDNAse (exonuclease V) beta subunit